jgi:hypothetical protein
MADLAERQQQPQRTNQAKSFPNLHSTSSPAPAPLSSSSVAAGAAAAGGAAAGAAAAVEKKESVAVEASNKSDAANAGLNEVNEDNGEHIQVVCRIRPPPLKKEKKQQGDAGSAAAAEEEEQGSCVSMSEEDPGLLLLLAEPKELPFKFDYVAGPHSSQVRLSQVFLNSISPFPDKVDFVGNPSPLAPTTPPPVS